MTTNEKKTEAARLSRDSDQAVADKDAGRITEAECIAILDREIWATT